ncbi:MAG: hypothetical protein N2Z20_05810 [Elusimicrobiales bacterium]|nr:hypothetical protein [Elusimicrobiales bacterium]
MTIFDNIKFYVFPCVFGVAWGSFEMIIGGYLHVINFPLKGALMAGIGCIFMNILRFYVNRFGVNLIACIVAALCKVISIGGFKIGPVIGIIVEGIIIEVVYSIFGLNRLSILIATTFAVLEGIPHFFVTNIIMYGNTIFDTYIKAASSISNFLGIKSSFFIYMFFIWIFLHFIVAFFSYLLTINVLRRIKNEIY